MKRNRKVREMASEYRFDYTKAKPNRFAEKMKLAGWTVEKERGKVTQKKNVPKKARRQRHGS